MPNHDCYGQLLNVLNGYSADGRSHPAPLPHYPGGDNARLTAAVIQSLFGTLRQAVAAELEKDQLRTALIHVVLSWLTATGCNTPDRLARLLDVLLQQLSPPAALTGLCMPFVLRRRTEPMTDQETDSSHGLLLGWKEPSRRAGTAQPFPTPIWDNADEGHLVTIAPTGAGKGVSCIIPALLSWRGPAIVIDPKGENCAVTIARRQAMGQQVHVLDPFGITGHGGGSLNPLDVLQPGEGCIEEDAAVIANLLIQGLTFKNDPFWDERATALIIEVIRQVMAVKDLAARTLGSVRRHLETLAAAGPTRELMMFGSDKTRASIFATAASHMGFVRGANVEASLQRSSISLDEIYHGDPVTVYLVLPPDRLASHGKLLRLWLGVMMTVIARRARVPDQPTLLLIDETAQLGALDELRTAVTLMRGYGVRVWSFWQDLSQIRRTYPDDWESLLNNAATLQVFGACSPHAASQMQQYLGDFLPKPLLSLKPNEMVLVRPGEQPSMVRRPNYLRDTMFAGLAAENPFHRDRPAPATPKSSTVLPFARAERTGGGAL